MILLPTFQTASSRFFYNIILESKVFILTFDWNARSENWFLTIECKEENTKINNLKIILNYPLLSQHKAIFPSLKGDLLLQKIDNTSDDFGYDNFLINYGLYYYTADEYNTWKVDNGIRS